MRSRKGEGNTAWVAVVFILVAVALIVLLVWIGRGSKIGFSGITKCVESYGGKCMSLSECQEKRGAIQYGADCEKTAPNTICCKLYSEE